MGQSQIQKLKLNKVKTNYQNYQSKRIYKKKSLEEN